MGSRIVKERGLGYVWSMYITWIEGRSQHTPKTKNIPATNICKIIFGILIWVRFDSLKAASRRQCTFKLTTKSPGVSDTYMVNINDEIMNQP